jgi:phospholipid/cholesterol/gamma-HCH transport system permease protein
MTPQVALAWIQAWGRTARFAFAAAAAVLSPSTYTARMRATAVKQVYFTVWQVFGGYILFSALMSAVVIEITLRAARDYGLGTYALDLVFRVLVLEILPLLTALFVALRSGAAISTEVALMQIGGELGAAEVDPFEREFVPRVLATAVSVFALTIMSGAMSLVISYLSMYGFSPWGFDEFTRAVANAFSPYAMIGFVLRSFAFGAVVAVIPIAAGLDATREMKSAPVAVMGGMVRLFFALGAIEVTGLAIKYA